MARGRPRRSHSSSSVETVDFSQVRWYQEASVVKAAPSDEDPLDHILFEVQDVTVYPRQDEDEDETDGETSSGYPNVLEVRIKGPFAARGTLIVEDDAQQKARVLVRKSKEIPIEIRTVHQFSIGETELRRPCIWILGRCGAWYEVVPSAAYKPTYDMMAEAVYLYYRILDFYGSPQERVMIPGKRDEITWLFFQYASTVGDGATYEDVAERCEKHALFLFYQFETEREFTVSPDEPLGKKTLWHTTEFYKWLKKRRNDALAAVQRALKNPPNITREAPIRRQNTLVGNPTPPGAILPSTQVKQEISISSRASVESSSDSSEDSTGHGASALPLRVPSAGLVIPEKITGSERAIAQGDSQPVKTPTHPLGETDRLAVRTLIEAVKVVWSLSKSQPVKASYVVQSIYMKYRFPDMRANGTYKKAVEEVFHYYARALLDDPAFAPFHDTHLHTWLLELAAKPFRYEGLGPDKFPFLIVPRKKVERLSKESDQSGGESSSHPTTGGKSLPRGRPRKSNLSIGPSRKRAHDAIDGNSDEEFEPKRSNYFSEADDVMDETTNTWDGSAEQEATTVPYGEPVDFIVRAEPLPSWVTRRSDGAWVCDRNSCDYVVRGETEDIARSRIQKHIAEHAPLRCDREDCSFSVLDEDEDVAQMRMEQHMTDLHGPWKCDREGCDFFARQENGAAEQRRVREHIASHEKQDHKLDLAKSESRPHLPIDHLLEKIRALGQRQDEARAAAAAAATSADAPRIKRKLLL
ncbi:hypothetical protein NLU13_9288 [Sarocladium strictum]|uniref:Uncharacterized protein n=1 Tax=Sarocladium strictum TaxID=5046 RepID=A0AA39L480_SARSR|nr:hypothetical protein NLU13_9288 [Sarocladium strictum]